MTGELIFDWENIYSVSRQIIREYMIPTNYYRLDRFPMLPTGKKNKTALLPPEGSWSQFFDEAICRTDVISSDDAGTVYTFGAHKVIKLFNQDYPLEKIVEEHKNSQAAHALDASKPETFGIIRSGGRCGIMYEA